MDVMLYATNEGKYNQMRYIEYDRLLEDRFPVCGEGTVSDPGMCYPPSPSDDIDAPQDATTCKGCTSTSQGPWMFGLLVGLFALRRRRE
ncbi:MAG: MYXO-CTERM domain-containing protein [Kiritimatiellia bacterium]|jgi:MYXO-CTERM domain-containing protein